MIYIDHDNNTCAILVVAAWKFIVNALVLVTTCTLTYLHFKHSERNLKQYDGALVEKEIPDSQQYFHVHDAGEGGQEPV